MLDQSRLGDLVHRQVLERVDRSAQVTGESIDYDPRSGSAVTVSRPRDPNAERPGAMAFRTARAFWPPSPPLRELSLQFLALRNVGDAGRGEDLRPMNLYRELLFAGTNVAPTAVPCHSPSSDGRPFGRPIAYHGPRPASSWQGGGESVDRRRLRGGAVRRIVAGAALFVSKTNSLLTCARDSLIRAERRRRRRCRLPRSMCERSGHIGNGRDASL